jgi:ABC-type nickel/cobalt efflux system permease component RcnA
LKPGFIVKPGFLSCSDTTSMARHTVHATVALLILPLGACAHPIAPQHHDRFVLVRLTEEAVLVEYTLALDSRTLIQDLFPFRDVDFSEGEQKLTKRFGELYGPLIAGGLVAHTESQELEFTCLRVDFKEEVDHLRYVFHLQARLNLPDRPRHRLRITDSSFMTQPGGFKLAVRSEGRVEILESNVESDLERAKVHALRGFNEKEEQLRTGSVTFRVHPLAAPVEPAALPPAPAAPEETDFWDVLRAQSLQKLLDSDLGLGLLLLVAFVFGSFHALQPGHGKTLVAAYLVGERGTVFHACYLGVVTTLTHTGIVILLALVVPWFFPEAESEVTFALSLGCGLLVVAMACWLLLRRLSGQADHIHLFGGHHHHHGQDGHPHHHYPEAPAGGSVAARVGWGALTLLGITGGLVPCVDALALLAATWVKRQLWLGLPLTLAFSLGLASVLVAIGVLVVKFKHFAGSRWGQGWFVKLLPMVSALLTLALGLWMCHEALHMRAEFAAASAQP